MFYHAASDTYILEGRPFTLGETQYPANWLNFPENREALGITEVTVSGSHGDPLYYNNTESLGNGVLTLVSTEKTDLVGVKTSHKNTIDSLAGSIRLSYLSQGEHVIREYDQAYDEAKTYKAAGYSGNVPVAISCWATASGMTNAEATDNIIAQGDFLKAKLDQIRSERLIGKSQIDAAADVTALKAAFDTCKSNLELLRNVS